MDRGFSLIEVVIASTLMTLAAVGLAQLSIASIHLSHVARVTTLATMLASQKVEQLRALTWAFDAAGGAVSDVATDTTATPEQPAGGTGLAASPTDALIRNTSGYCDFLDASGRSLGGGTVSPMGTAYIRRWSIGAIVNTDALVIQVGVAPITVPDLSTARRRAEEARIIAIKTRKSG